MKQYKVTLSLVDSGKTVVTEERSKHPAQATDRATRRVLAQLGVCVVDKVEEVELRGPNVSWLAS